MTELDSIKDTYRIIATTKKGSVVLNPNIGWNIMQYLSKPFNEVVHKMAIELRKELNYQEPRATVTDVVIDDNGWDKGRCLIKVVFNYNQRSETAVLQV